MSDQNENSESLLPATSGFEDEGATAEETNSVPVKPKKAKTGNLERLKANFSSVFGHGIGKASLIVVGLFIVVAGAFIYRGVHNAGVPGSGKASNVDLPQAPQADVNINAIDAKEAGRRAQQAALEADGAANKGQSYQPDFAPVVTPPAAGASAPAQAAAQQGSAPQGAPAQTQQGTQNGQGGNAPPLPNGAQPQPGQPVQIAVSTGQQTANSADDQRRQQEVEKQRAARDKYVGDLRKGVTDQVDRMLGQNGQKDPTDTRGTYSVVHYLPAPKAAAPAAVAPVLAGTTSAASAVAAAAEKATGSMKKATYKAGKMAFAETDSEVDTDDGMDVIATMRGGPFDGAKLLGKVEVTPRNISFHFTTLSPQDDRPSISINAIAIREEDAKQGVADSIDNHTLARYSALFTSSMLSGLGKAAQQPQGTIVVLPNGQTVTQESDVSNKRLAMYALGDVGTNAAAEVKKFVDTPPTYKVSAHRGIGVIFLSDVVEK